MCICHLIAQSWSPCTRVDSELKELMASFKWPSDPLLYVCGAGGACGDCSRIRGPLLVRSCFTLFHARKA